MLKFKFSEFIKSDIETIKENANFSELELEIFSLLCKNQYTDYAIYSQLNLSEGKYYANKKVIKNKIKRIIENY